MDGFIQLHRSLLDCAEVEDPKALAVWVRLLLHASHRERTVVWRGRKIELGRGELVISQRDFAERCGITYQQLRTILEKFAAAEMLESNAISNAKGSLIRICNYSRFQDASQAGNAEANAEKRQQRNANAISNAAVTQKKSSNDTDLSEGAGQPATQQQFGFQRSGNAENNKGRILDSDSPSGESPSPGVKNADPHAGLVEKAAEVWNRVCGDVLPKLREVTPKRRAPMRKRLIDDCGGSLEAWEGYCRRIRASSFCCGNNRRGWTADIDFALKSESFVKVLEGKYDNRAPPNGGNDYQPRADMQHQRYGPRRASPTASLRANLEILEGPNDDEPEFEAVSLSSGGFALVL